MPRLKGSDFANSDLQDLVMADQNSGCWLWLHAYIGQGYGSVRWKGKDTTASRAAYEKYSGMTIPDNLFVLHKCDTPACVNPTHLFLGTQADNMADKCAKGRQSHTVGENVGISKLTEEEVRDIFHANGTHRSIAKQFGIDHSGVTRIKNSTTWGHLQLAEKL